MYYHYRKWAKLVSLVLFSEDPPLEGSLTQAQPTAAQPTHTSCSLPWLLSESESSVLDRSSSDLLDSDLCSWWAGLWGGRSGELSSSVVCLQSKNKQTNHYT